MQRRRFLQLSLGSLAALTTAGRGRTEELQRIYDGLRRGQRVVVTTYRRWTWLRTVLVPRSS